MAINAKKAIAKFDKMDKKSDAVLIKKVLKSTKKGK